MGKCIHFGSLNSPSSSLMTLSSATSFPMVGLGTIIIPNIKMKYLVDPKMIHKTIISKIQKYDERFNVGYL